MKYEALNWDAVICVQNEKDVSFCVSGTSGAQSQNCSLASMSPTHRVRSNPYSKDRPTARTAGCSKAAAAADQPAADLLLRLLHVFSPSIVSALVAYSHSLNVVLQLSAQQQHRWASCRPDFEPLYFHFRLNSKNWERRLVDNRPIEVSLFDISNINQN